MMIRKELEIRKTIEAVLEPTRPYDDLILVIIPHGNGLYECMGETVKCEDCFNTLYAGLIRMIVKWLHDIGYDESAEEVISYIEGTLGFSSNEDWVMDTFGGYGRRFSFDVRVA